jgi:hypothetical protein
MLPLGKLDLDMSFQVDLVNIFPHFTQALFKHQKHTTLEFFQLLSRIYYWSLLNRHIGPITAQLSVLRGL